MATRSIIKNIHIANKSQGHDFINALEEAEKKRGKIVRLSREIFEVKDEVIESMFEGGVSDK